MDVNQMTFGIEIETTIPAGTIPVGPRHSTLQALGLPAGWSATGDGSIVARSGRVGCEFVSPILRGEEGLRQVVDVCRTLRTIGAQVNPSCGVHVHVGFDRNDRDALARLITLVANYEKAIFASTGTKSRERGRWCAGIQAMQSRERVERSSSRYQILNLTNLTYGGKPTVEFRAFSGSLDASKIIGWVQTCLGLVQLACESKRVTKWAAKAPVATSPIHRSGEGQTALTRLFYKLGWIKGRTSRTYGVIPCAGSPSLKTIKRTLMKLARKYDAQA